MVAGVSTNMIERLYIGMALEFYRNASATFNIEESGIRTKTGTI